MNDQQKIEICARAAHEVSRSYDLATGVSARPPWDEEDDWVREACRREVMDPLSGNSSEQYHQKWLADKINDGWKYGFVEDRAKKESPRLVPYTALSEEQKAKDRLYVDVVRAVGRALGLPVPFTITFHIEQKFAAGMNPDQVLTAIHQDLEQLLKRPVGLRNGETEKTK